MAKIFINYRREDSAGYAGRLYDFLSEQLGEREIFMDIDAIQPGADFVKVINNAVGSCQMLVALIGKDWLSISDAEGQRRLDDTHDFVRLEISKALESGILVVPVLVGEARMPREGDLPTDLQPLAYRNAIALSNKNFRRDAAVLIDQLNKLAMQEPTPFLTATNRFSRFAVSARFRAMVSLIVLIVGLAMLVGSFAFTWVRINPINLTADVPTEVTEDQKVTVMDLWLGDSGVYDAPYDPSGVADPEPALERLDFSLMIIPISGLLLMILGGLYYLRTGEQNAILIGMAVISIMMFVFPIVWEDFDKEHLRQVSPSGIIYSSSEFLFLSMVSFVISVLKLGMNLGTHSPQDRE